MVESLAREIWQEHYIPIIGKDQVAYMLDTFQSVEAIAKQIKEGTLYYLIKYDKPVGYFSVALEEEALFLSKIYLKSQARGSGLGKITFNFIEQLAKQANKPKIRLTVNRNNILTIKAYEKWGLEAVGELVIEIGSDFVMDDYVMEKRL